MLILGMLHEPEFQPWNISENMVPKGEPKVEQLKFLLKYAILAPSSHNTQATMWLNYMLTEPEP